MRRLLQDQVIQIELPSTNEQFYHELVEGINDIHRLFGNDYEIVGFFVQRREIHIKGPIGDFTITIKNQGPIDGEEYEGIEEVTYDVDYKLRDFTFLEW
jgi:hypothetical protein